MGSPSLCVPILCITQSITRTLWNFNKAVNIYIMSRDNCDCVLQRALLEGHLQQYVRV